MNIPQGPYALTSEWLTNVLRQRAIITSAEVTTIEVEPLDDKGLMSQLARLHLTYQGSEAGIPSSIVSKFSSADPGRRDLARSLRLYEKEIRFYEEIAKTIAMRTPQCFYSLFVPETTEHILLLEDLSPARPGSQIVGCSLDEMELAIREIVKLHATWWNHTQLEEKDWLTIPHLNQQIQDIYRQRWPSFLDKAGDLVPAEMHSIGEELCDQYVNVTDPLYGPPLTMIHRDFHLDNFLFDLQGQTGSLAVIDWQFVTKGRGPFDIAFIMSRGLHPADRKVNEIGLLRTYHQLLEENGVRGYSFDQALEDYRRALLTSFVQIAVAIGSGAYDDKLDAMRETLIPRTIAAILDHNCGGLL